MDVVAKPNPLDTLVLAIVLVVAAAIALAGCSIGDGACPDVMPGDVSLDGRIDVVDAAMVWNHVQGYRRLSACSIRAADYDGDRRVTERDADAIFAAWLGGAKRWPSFRAYLADRCLAGDPLPEVPVCP